MSDIRKWLKIMENVSPTLLNQHPKSVVIKKDATVMVAPRAGGGTARYMHSTPQGAMVDIKGVAKELGHNDFSLPNHDYEDPYVNGNTWDHSSEEEDTVGTMRDKPEFRSGDLVKIEDVYGSSIGPGFGVFVAYSTSGQECIVSFDNKEIVVPIANVGAVAEQNSKDNFNQTDNDGNLSPMSLGSQNVKVEKEPEMDHKDEFSKWISAVEEALSNEGAELDENAPVNECGCGQWDCVVCFPDHELQNPVGPVDGNDGHPEGTVVIGGTDMIEPDASAGLHAATDEINADEFSGLEEVGMSDDMPVDEEEQDFEQVERPRSGKGVKLGDIVTKTEFRKTGGEDSPMTYGEENLDEGPDEMGADMSDDFSDSAFDHSESADMIDTIMYMQSMGLSNAQREYDQRELAMMSGDELKQAHDMVTGDVSEATLAPAADDEPEPKPFKTKTKHPLDDLDDVLTPRDAQPLANVPEPEAHGDEPATDEPSMELPAASRDTTQDRLRGMSPSDTMRDYMNRINPEAGATEPELPDTPANELVLRTASDVPAVISHAMRATGVQSPEWHHIRNLPGYQDRNIRGMGRSVFSMFTSTPVEQIQTIANVEGQGPNTDAELRAVAGWLRDHAEDLGDVEVSHGMAIPGYQPQVKEYRANGIRFHVVQDPMGQYIYAYPDKDARLAGPASQEQGRLAGGRNMPRLGESTEGADMKLIGKPTLFEQLKWDEEINAILKEMALDEEQLDESTLSKMIGKQKGGQRLVQWLHRKHKLSNEADLVPAPFSERLLWKEFKSNPDNFVIVSASGGVAGVKPHKEFIDNRTKEFAKKGKTYNPAGDSTLPYQIIAFTDDGEQVDPNLLRQPVAPGEEPEERHPDPTVMRARMGKISGKDMQNPTNTFNLLADQIGTLRTVWVANSAVERDKMTKRDELKKGAAELPEMEAIQLIFKRVRPVLKTLANQALSQIHNRAKRYIDGGNFEAAQKVAQSGNRLKQFLATIDTTGDITLNQSYGHALKPFTDNIIRAVTKASGAEQGSDEYKAFLDRAARGSAMELKPVLDSLRDSLVELV